MTGQRRRGTRRAKDAPGASGLGECRRPIAPPDVTVTSWDAVLWLAKLTTDGPLVGCMVCHGVTGTIWGVTDASSPIGKVGLHPYCVEAGLDKGLMAGVLPKVPAQQAGERVRTAREQALWDAQEVLILKRMWEGYDR